MSEQQKAWKCPLCAYWSEGTSGRQNLMTHFQRQHPTQRVWFRDGRKKRTGPRFRTTPEGSTR